MLNIPLLERCRCRGLHWWRHAWLQAIHFLKLSFYSRVKIPPITISVSDAGSCVCGMNLIGWVTVWKKWRCYHKSFTAIHCRAKNSRDNHWLFKDSFCSGYSLEGDPLIFIYCWLQTGDLGSECTYHCHPTECFLVSDPWKKRPPESSQSLKLCIYCKVSTNPWFAETNNAPMNCGNMTDFHWLHANVGTNWPV